MVLGPRKSAPPPARERWRPAVSPCGGALLLSLTAPALPSAPAVANKKTLPNLVLITLDTTRADHLGASGYAGAHPQPRRPGRPRHPLRPLRHRRPDHPAQPRDDPDRALPAPPRRARQRHLRAARAKVETLAERLAARGYDTAAVVSAVVLARRQGLDQGFRIYDDDLGDGLRGRHRGGGAAGRGHHGRPRSPRWRGSTRRSSSGSTTSIRTRSTGRPPASPTGQGPTPPLRRRDRLHGRADRRAPQEAAARHGRGGRRRPRRDARASTASRPTGCCSTAAARRVPLILAGPGVPAGRASDCLVRTADVAPTFLALASVAAPGLDGQSLLPSPRARLLAARPTPRASCRSSPISGTRCARSATTASCICKAPKGSLYDLAADPARRATWRRRSRRRPGPGTERLSASCKGWERADTSVRPENVLSEEQRAPARRAWATSAARPRGRSPRACPIRAP